MPFIKLILCSHDTYNTCILFGNYLQLLAMRSSKNGLYEYVRAKTVKGYLIIRLPEIIRIITAMIAITKST